MKKFFTILLFIAILIPFAKAQNTTDSKQVTVVYLLPLNSSGVEQSKSVEMKDSKDIDRTFAKSVIGFWCGAQIALDELSEKGHNLKVIAREVNGDDSVKIERIFEEEDVRNAQLIIAPVTKKMFPIVAAHAKELRIPVVNPMSPNSEIVEGNPFVYKMFPHPDAKAAALVENFENAHFIIWGNHQSEEYTRYFNEHDIAYTVVDEESSFTSHLKSDADNVVIACPAHTNAYAQVANMLVNRSRMPEFHWVLPESLLNDNGFDLRTLSPFDLYFLSGFFADDQGEDAQVFCDKYVRTYSTLPTVKNFAYQGYDATYFFCELIINNFHIPKDFTPLCCKLKFRRGDKANGFENYGVRLVQLKHLQYTIINQ
ncbi:MAG: amino acid ABC transporter substrate-binding protein [Bacteroidales bacterium]|nr:amino acid ABC transporter substrate-binding protein [Bacteroidales bacterium]